MSNKSFIALLVTLAMWLSPALSDAAGLGRLKILSAMGQPLAAEIELVAVGKEEMSSLAAHIASPDAFDKANITFTSALLSAKATVERRPGGQPYIRLTSTRSVDEPFIDLLIELTWNTGRIVRAYTVLLDPPGIVPGRG